MGPMVGLTSLSWHERPHGTPTLRGRRATPSPVPVPRLGRSGFAFLSLVEEVVVLVLALVSGIFKMAVVFGGEGEAAECHCHPVAEETGGAVCHVG